MTLYYNSFDKTAITLKMLIDANLINPGQELFCPNPNAKGVINKDGSLKLIYEGKEVDFPFLSGAARYVEKRSLNGWIYWYTTTNGESQRLDTFRDQYLKQKEKP